MAKYYFHLQDHVAEFDKIGTDINSLAEARTEAIRFAGAMLADEPNLLDQDFLTVATCDEYENPLFTVEIRITRPD